MRKIMVIAVREYLAAVRTKAFLIGLLILPIMMGGSVSLQFVLKNQVDTKVKRFAIVDRTDGQHLGEAIEKAARRRNEQLIFDPKTGRQVKPIFAIEHIEPSTVDSDSINRQRFELSQRVVHKELFGFAEIGPEVYAAGPTRSTPGVMADDELSLLKAPHASDRVAIRYQSNSPTYDGFHRWLGTAVNLAIQEVRSVKAGLPPGKLEEIEQPVPLLVKGLSKQNPQTGAIEDAADENFIISLLAPGGLIILMFMMVLLGSTPLMQSVVEEKMQRIAEVLLGSVQPFQLMMGKLIGMVGVSLTLAGVYLAGAYWAARQYDLSQFISIEVLGWFVLFQILAVLMYGSLFIAIGAACTDMRETQSLLWPVMLLACLPLFVWINVVREPNSTFSQWVSLFPFATPMLMVGRQAVPPGIGWWQPLLGVFGVLMTTTICVYAAGRIFRIGILMQGKGAHLGELVKWVIRG